MKTYINPPLSDWTELTKRPTKEAQDLQALVLDVFNEIRIHNKLAVHTKKYFIV